MSRFPTFMPSSSDGDVNGLETPAIRQIDPSQHYDYLIVGAGFAGCVLAERLASQLGVELYEKFFEGYTRKQWGLDAS